MEDYSVVISKTNSQSTAFLRILDNDICRLREKDSIIYIYYPNKMQSLQRNENCRPVLSNFICFFALMVVQVPNCRWKMLRLENWKKKEDDALSAVLLIISYCVTIKWDFLSFPLVFMCKRIYHIKWLGSDILWFEFVKFCSFSKVLSAIIFAISNTHHQKKTRQA